MTEQSPENRRPVTGPGVWSGTYRYGTSAPPRPFPPNFLGRTAPAYKSQGRSVVKLCSQAALSYQRELLLKGQAPAPGRRRGTKEKKKKEKHHKPSSPGLWTFAHSLDPPLLLYYVAPLDSRTAGLAPSVDVTRAHRYHLASPTSIVAPSPWDTESFLFRLPDAITTTLRSASHPPRPHRRPQTTISSDITCTVARIPGAKQTKKHQQKNTTKKPASRRALCAPTSLPALAGSTPSHRDLIARLGPLLAGPTRKVQPSAAVLLERTPRLADTLASGPNCITSFASLVLASPAPFVSYYCACQFGRTPETVSRQLQSVARHPIFLVSPLLDPPPTIHL